MSSQFDTQLNQAAQLEQSGRLDEAAALYQSLRKERPGDNRAWMMNALLDLRRGNSAGAVSTLESYIQSHEPGPDMLALLATGYRSVNRVEDALVCWNRYLDATPGDPRALHEIGSCQLLAGDRDAADTTFGKFVESQAGSAESLLATALAYHTAGFTDPAADLYRRTLASSPGMQLARRNLAAIHQVQGEFDEAETLYRAVIAAEPGNFEVIENLGTLYKDQDRLVEALGCYHNAMRLRRAIPQDDLHKILANDPGLAQTSVHSLKLQAEQLDYLIGKGKIDGSFKRHRDAVLDVIRELERSHGHSSGQSSSRSHRIQLTADQFARIGYTMSRLVHLGPTDALPRGALNPDLDAGEITADYRKNAPGVTWIDGLLKPDALQALRDYCLESTIWFDFGKAGGYSGSYMQHGFGSDLLVQIATELRAALPDIFGLHVLNQMWAYIYDSQMSGITVHADKAAVNLNFWITPDDANLDADSGGLVVYTREAPAEWSFDDYNSKPAEIEAFVADSESITVPHRCNRAVLFHSNLVHKTDDFTFKDGLENRRINITMLFGERGD